jgi:hypothetical protein
LWIERAPHFKLVDEVASKLVAGDGGTHLLLAQSLGYDGAGVTVAVADSGLDSGLTETVHPDLAGRALEFFYYGALTDGSDEHSHGTHVAGIIAGDGATGQTDANGALYGLGVAPGASIIGQRIFDGVGNYEAPAGGFSQLTRDAIEAGAVIGSNSWGDDTQGRYDLSAMAYDELVRDATGSGTNHRPFIIEFSAGNAGPGTQTMDSPAVAKNVIATGASQNDREDLFIYADGPETMADFSSRGPCEDGRIKPDLVAPGTWIASLQSSAATDESAWLPINGLYQYQGGTSQAGPHVSGAAAVFVQYYREVITNTLPSPALVKAALINAAYDLDDSFGTAPVPNNDEGWGVVDLTPILDPFLGFEYIDQTRLLTNGAVFEHRVLVAGADEAFKVTLAYTDVAGFPGALPVLVNDLDLEVLAPDGVLYRGNQFMGGESIPNAPAADALNNVEGVHLYFPVAGEYVVRVRATRVVRDILNAPGTPRQDFALVLSGFLPIPGEGSVSLDRASYTAPGQLRITVIDTDQAKKTSVNIRLTSSTELNGESVDLAAVGTLGSFQGLISTASGTAQVDGRLQIKDGDDIEVRYQDTSAGQTRFANAIADLVPPNLENPSLTNIFGEEIISWQTSEPATSLVYYGTNRNFATLSQVVTNSELTLSHSLGVNGLIPGLTYFFYLVSADEAGNRSTNAANGQFFSFIAPTNATVLLVDSYGEDPVSGAVPLLDPYTEALNALGVSYDLWDVASMGPATNVLKGYRMVIFRVPELLGVWTSVERSAISNYLHTGGSIFIASMQLLSRLELEAADLSFIRNVLKVESFVPDPDSTGASQITGSGNETIGKGIDIALDYSLYEERWSLFGFPVVDPVDISETMTPRPAAMPVLRNDYGDVVGIRWPAVGQVAAGRLVFFSFPLDAVPGTDGINDRTSLMRNVIAFLAPGASGLANVALDAPAYTLPSVATIEVADANLAGNGRITVSVSSTTRPEGLSVTLEETAARGTFLGRLKLVANATPPSPGTLGCTHGDLLRVDYFSPAANRIVSASAEIDTAPPEISTVLSEPDYESTAIFWETSEVADSLVQYGESPLLGRTAYSSIPTSSHEVMVAGLTSDRTYYYRVLSVDMAGNYSIDDNQGKLYTFRTLLPLSPPWADSMDGRTTNWLAYSDSSSQCEWTLGVPANDQASEAHSPPHAWGSNLEGSVIDSASTFLISPALKLPPAGTITLRFWHSYDFSLQSETDIYEQGELLMITNNSSVTPISLAGFTDDITGGWEEEEIDLSRYAGHLIYLVWDYELFSFDPRPRAGWMIDDVSITVADSATGTILISNNLWSATTFLSGPLVRTNRGAFTAISNAPAGVYTLRFEPVPFYDAPSSQTNTLASGNTTVFSGSYTFPDTNTNGMSDSWEQSCFGSVAPNRTQLTDTDKDGASDYAEFMAGTDPLNPDALKLAAQLSTIGMFDVTWSSVPGRAYRVLSSTNAVQWTPLSSWVQATSPASGLSFPVPGVAGPRFYRVEVSP